MGLWDILYDMVKEYRTIKGDEKRKILLAKSMARKAYLRFNYDWVTEKKIRQDGYDFYPNNNVGILCSILY
jgi:hypothetical protein